MQKTSKFALLSVMLCFFTMGFVDLVGIASNYVQKDLGLTHAQANIMPSLVFFWFLIFSVPTGMLMNKIGRKKTVMLSIIVTVLSLVLPLCGESYALMLCAFSLLGIGNALMQTSLNPLVSNIVTGNLSSTLTFGQFVKAIASSDVGCHGGYSEYGIGLESALPDLCGDRCDCYPRFGVHVHP